MSESGEHYDDARLEMQVTAMPIAVARCCSRLTKRAFQTVEQLAAPLQAARVSCERHPESSKTIEPDGKLELRIDLRERAERDADVLRNVRPPFCACPSAMLLGTDIAACRNCAPSSNRCEAGSIAAAR